jgi:hypothetical protein
MRRLDQHHRTPAHGGQGLHSRFSGLAFSLLTRGESAAALRSGYFLQIAVCCLATLLLIVGRVSAQPATSLPAAVQPPASQPAGAASQNAEDPLAEGRRLLAGVHDGVFSFDDAGFYWLCRYVKRHADPGEFAITAHDTPVPWRQLVERPSDYRGQLVAVEGILQARPAFIQTGPGRGDIGKLTQCELSEIGTRSFCSVITIEDADQIPVHSRVRAKGYFVKARGYQTNDGETGAGPLIVARRLEVVTPPTSGLGGGAVGLPGGTTAIMVATAGLAVVWLLLRRSLRPPVGSEGRRGPGGAGGRPSDADFDWVNELPREDQERPRDG